MTGIVRMTAAEFSQLEQSTQPIQLIHGEVIVSPSPKNAHQEWVEAVFFFLRGWSKNEGGSGLAKVAPMDVYLDEANVVQPDVFWLSGEGSLCRLGEDGYFHGAPDLVVEVLSPRTAKLDRAEKFRLYEQHGTREYWLIEPQGPFVEVFQREGEHLRRVGAFGPGEPFEAAVLGGLTVDLAAVFA